MALMKTQRELNAQFFCEIWDHQPRFLAIITNKEPQAVGYHHHEHVRISRCTNLEIRIGWIYTPLLASCYCQSRWNWGPRRDWKIEHKQASPTCKGCQLGLVRLQIYPETTCDYLQQVGEFIICRALLFAIGLSAKVCPTSCNTNNDGESQTKQYLEREAIDDDEPASLPPFWSRYCVDRNWYLLMWGFFLPWRGERELKV